MSGKKLWASQVDFHRTGIKSPVEPNSYSSVDPNSNSSVVQSYIDALDITQTSTCPQVISLPSCAPQPHLLSSSTNWHPFSKIIDSHTGQNNYIEPCIDKNETIALVDFLNLARKLIAGRSDAKFKTIEEFMASIREIAFQINKIGNFEKIYLVTKSFKFNEEISYNDILRIIVWSFCDAIPEWKDSNKIILVLVNGINDKDAEADDRTLFILYKEFLMTTDKRVVILSNDNFESIKSHYLRKVVLNFYSIGSIGSMWKTTKIYPYYKAEFKQNKKNVKSSYIVIHPNTNITNLIEIS